MVVDDESDCTTRRRRWPWRRCDGRWRPQRRRRWGRRWQPEHGWWRRRFPNERRLVVCKELVHLFDKPVLTTNSRDEINALIDNLVEGFDLAKVSPGDWQAIKDKLALYQALAILFPHEAREELVPLYEKGQIDEAWIAEAFCIPYEYVEFLMSSKWDSFRQVLSEV
jgi:hypothetical protein